MGDAARACVLTTHLQLVPSLRINGAIPLLPLYAFKAGMRQTLFLTLRPMI